MMDSSLSLSEYAEYVTDVAYPAHFHREIMPVWLVSTLQALGRQAPDISASYTWLELGCGVGLSTLIAAACNPDGQFIGIDFSQREIEKAQKIADEAGLQNVQFIRQDLQTCALQANTLPQPDCDFIVTHGVYSWVSELDRQAIHRIVAQRLKPAGVAYLSYMSQPGAVSFAAAQKLMRMHSLRIAGDSAQKAQASMDLVLDLARQGAGYFIEHPAIQREMERANHMSPAYMAHEFLSEEWHSLHISDVMRELGRVECEYAGSATLLDNIDAVSVPSGIQPMLVNMQQQGVGVEQLETVRDIARNQNQRRDLYQKLHSDGRPCVQSPAQHREVLLSQRVMALPAAPQHLGTQGELVLETRIGPVKIPVATLSPLMEALSESPKTYAELARLPAYRSNPGLISQLLQVLTWNGWTHFMRPALANAPKLQYAHERAKSLAQVLNQEGFARWQLLPQIGSAVELMKN